MTTSRFPSLPNPAIASAMNDQVITNAHESIKVGSKSFALASRVLPPALRDDASMLYAWCRHCDDVIDGQDMGHGLIENYKEGQLERLEELRVKTKAALSGAPTDDPIFAGLARVISTHQIDHKHPFDHLAGFEMDATNRVYVTVDDVLDYSYHVAGVVGVMMAQIMGVREEVTLGQASDLGLAFQLTNIARDVIDDARAGRVFVPKELLTKHGAPTEAEALAGRGHWDAAYAAAIELLDIAEGYYASARIGIKALPFRCAWAIRAALNVYREIGEVLRAKGPSAWEGRVGAGNGRKLWLAVRGVV